QNPPPGGAGTPPLRARQRRQDLLEILRQLGAQMYLLARARMQEFQLPRVQTLALQPALRLLRTVDHVAQQRMADIRHVYPDLVRPPRLKPAADVRPAPVAGYDLPVRHRRARAALRHRHALALRRVAAYRRVHRSRLIPELAARYGLIHPREA